MSLYFGKAIVIAAAIAGCPFWVASAQQTSLLPIQTDTLTIPDQGYRVDEIGRGLYWFSDGFQQSFFLTTGEGVIAVDAPPSFIDKYLKAIGEITDEPITHVIYSHAHTDHIGAANQMPKNAVRIAHQLTYDALVKAADPRRPLPGVMFTESFELVVGDQQLLLRYDGPNHRSGNIIMYAPEQKVLSLMDFLFTGSSPFPYFGHAEDIPSMIRHHNILLAYDFEVFVSGHISRAATRSDIEAQREYMIDLRDAVDQALTESTVFETYGRLGSDTAIMTAMSVWLDEVASRSSEIMMQKWQGKWPGIETTTKYNAVPMIQSRRVD